MRETPAELAALQALLDRSYAAAGEHLRAIHTPERRLTAGALLEIYVPRYGPEWEAEMLDGGTVYARIEAERMFTFSMP